MDWSCLNKALITRCLRGRWSLYKSLCNLRVWRVPWSTKQKKAGHCLPTPSTHGYIYLLSRETERNILWILRPDFCRNFETCKPEKTVHTQEISQKYLNPKLSKHTLLLSSSFAELTSTRCCFLTQNTEEMKSNTIF